MVRWIVVIVVAMGLAGGCGKRRRASGPDLSSPKSAALAFTRAIESGDPNTAQLASYASGIEIELVAAMAEAMPALKRLNDAATAKYGEEARMILENPDMLSSSKALDGAEVSMDAGRAKLTNKNGEVLTQLKEVNGDWKVDVGASIAGRDIRERVPSLKALAKAADEVTAQIKDGKFATAADALRELQLRLVVELRGKPPSTTRSVLQRDELPELPDPSAPLVPSGKP